MTTYNVYDANDVLISTVSDGVLLTLPNGDVVSPLIDGWSNGLYRIAAEETPIAPEASIPNLTFAQLLIGLVSEGWITVSEGEAWLSGASLPQAVETLLATIADPVERFAARARAIRPSVVERYNTLVIGLSTIAGKTDEELDAFFQAYSDK